MTITFDIVAITASAGGLNAISNVLSDLFARHDILNKEELETINMELCQRTNELNLSANHAEQPARWRGGRRQ